MFLVLSPRRGGLQCSSLYEGVGCSVLVLSLQRGGLQYSSPVFMKEWAALSFPFTLTYYLTNEKNCIFYFILFLVVEIKQYKNHCCRTALPGSQYTLLQRKSSFYPLVAFIILPCLSRIHFQLILSIKSV